MSAAEAIDDPEVFLARYIPELIVVVELEGAGKLYVSSVTYDAIEFRTKVVNALVLSRGHAEQVLARVNRDYCASHRRFSLEYAP